MNQSHQKGAYVGSMHFKILMKLSLKNNGNKREFLPNIFIKFECIDHF